VELNYKTVIARVFKLTRNLQDAEDAVQSAYVYQLTHRLKRKHFLGKALTLAKNASLDKMHFEKESKIHSVCDSHEEVIIAKDSYVKLHAKLTPKNQRTLVELLENGANPAEAAEATGRSSSNFKALIHNIRENKV